jgi:hypothetical protein
MLTANIATQKDDHRYSPETWAWHGQPRMAARLTCTADRINVEARRMTLAPAVDTLSGLAPQL